VGEQLKKLCSKLNHTRMKNSTTLTWILRDSNQRQSARNNLPAGYS